MRILPNLGFHTFLIKERCFYLYRGGYNSVIITDIIQAVIILAIITLPFFITADPKHIYDLGSFGNFGWVETIALMVFPFFWNLGSPDVWQRIFSAKDDKTVQIGLPLGAVCFALLTLAIVYLGIALRTHLPNVDPNTLFTLIFTENVFSPFILTAILVAIFAMGMSTLDTWSYVFSSTLIKDVLHTQHKNTQKQEAATQYVKQTKQVTILFLASASTLALSFESLVTVLMGVLSSYAIATPMVCVILFNLIKKSPVNDKIIALASALGFILFIYWHFTGFFGASFVRSMFPVSVTSTIILLWAFTLRILHTTK